MINKQFEAYKLKRELKRSGAEYKFRREALNEFGEPSNREEQVGVVKGLYHEQNGHIQVTTGDTTQTRTKKIPCIMCLWEDANRLSLKVGDKVQIGRSIYRVTGVVDIQNWSIISDISLEVVDNGIQA